MKMTDIQTTLPSATTPTPIESHPPRMLSRCPVESMKASWTTLTDVPNPTFSPRLAQPVVTDARSGWWYS